MFHSIQIHGHAGLLKDILKNKNVVPNENTAVHR